MRIYKTIILPVILYGCETWSLTLREEHRLKAFKNKVLRRRMMIGGLSSSCQFYEVELVQHKFVQKSDGLANALAFEVPSSGI
jgi:hypothetical protein